jgi:serine/threonine-protein kinase HipA
MKARILATNVDLDEGTCSLDLWQGAAVFFGLGPKSACAIIREVMLVTCTWKAVADEVGVRRTEITRMPRVFEHYYLRAALQLYVGIWPRY